MQLEVRHRIARTDFSVSPRVATWAFPWRFVCIGMKIRRKGGGEGSAPSDVFHYFLLKMCLINIGTYSRLKEGDRLRLDCVMR